MFTLGEEVRAMKVTRIGVMNPEKYNLGRVGIIKDVASTSGMGTSYAVEFGNYGGYRNTDWIDEVCLERVP